MKCPKCGSIKLWNKGKDFRLGAVYKRYKCKDCKHPFYAEIAVQSNVIECIESSPQLQPRNEKDRTFVIGAAVNDVALNAKFLKTIQSYCSHNNAKLLIRPIKYDQNGSHEYNWPSEIQEFFITENIKLTTGLKLLAGINISPAIGNPLSGFENFSQGDSIIIPHSQLMLKSVAMSQVDPAAVMYTTGCITEPSYTQTKQGCKADYNHSYSVLVIEEDFEIDGFHIRVLNSSEDGSFYDLDKFYDGDLILDNQEIDGIVLGDEHIVHKDIDVSNATFFNEDSIVNTLKPKTIIRHDVLDFYSGTHHHQKNIFIKYAKHISGKDNVYDELKETVEYILQTTPKYAESIIISSNHNSHLLQWLNECNPKLDPRNALLYHELMFLMFKDTKMNGSMAEYPNPFELWAKHNYNTSNIKFVGEQDSFKIHDIECGYHGHKGTNGARGSAEGFSKLGNKTIVGHSHSPAIINGCFQVGTNSLLKLDYNLGSSSWGHADVLIHKNGKRQMIFIIKGKWKR
ncbi:MAG: hypothetical protein PHG08_00400 [Bacilli bacterium]|nr:hypothetical protein [Bacilli bacterium]